MYSRTKHFAQRCCQTLWRELSSRCWEGSSLAVHASLFNSFRNPNEVHLYELKRQIPDPALVPILQTEELAGMILLILRNRTEHPTQFNMGNELAAFRPSGQSRYGQPTTDLWEICSEAIRDEATLAFVEAWAWLTAQGLLVPKPDDSYGAWKVLSRRAKTFENPKSFSDYAKARLLPREILLPQLSGSVWLAFMRGEYDTAVFQAFKTVEVAVREAGQFGADLVGTKLMRKAFDPKEGPLADQESEDGEKEARSSLFAGAIGSYKNPQSHRDVNLENPAEAIELILFANHLLRIVATKASV